MTSPKPGDIWLASIPFSDRTGNKLRPVLVMWVDGVDAIVSSVTSARKRTAQDVELADWRRAGLRQPSTVRLLRLATLDTSLLNARVGRLSRNDAARAVATWLTHVKLRL